MCSDALNGVVATWKLRTYSSTRSFSSCCCCCCPSGSWAVRCLAVINVSKIVLKTKDTHRHCGYGNSLKWQYITFRLLLLGSIQVQGCQKSGMESNPKGAWSPRRFQMRFDCRIQWPHRRFDCRFCFFGFGDLAGGPKRREGVCKDLWSSW